MKRSVTLLLPLFLLSALCSFADVKLAIVTVPFSFSAEGKTFPAGTYNLIASDNQESILLRGTDTGKAEGLVSVFTRLAMLDNSKDTSVVFDVVGNNHYLSEIHVPNQDGYFFKPVAGKHTHITIKGK